MTEHKADDERHENGEEIPSAGAEIDPSLLSSDVFANKWKTLGEWGTSWLSEQPPKRRWLLERKDESTNGRANPIGVLPMGKVGMLVAAGGVGKTMALAQLALAVATGREWFDAFITPSDGGRVLLALGEEDEDEVRRRMYNAARAMRLTDAHMKLAAERIVALPLAGTSVALTTTEGRSTSETPTLTDLRKRLADGPGWSLLILDPLSRFAGCDTEKDNAAATRFIEAAESLTKAPGSPTVLLAHHTNKVSRAGDSEASASDARGASGLTDGARWAASLVRSGDDRATFQVTKSNYALWGPPIVLVRDPDNGGALRAETRAEREARAAVATPDKQQATKIDGKNKPSIAPLPKGET
jgi:hypothetical protein